MLTATRRELEDIFLGLGFTVMEGPEVETVHYNFDALNHSPTHPARARTDTFYVDATERRAAHAHLADAGARDGGAPAAAVRRRSPGASTGPTPTPRTRRSSTRSRGSRSTRTSRSPTSRARCWRSRARSSATQRDVRLRPHFFPFTEPSVEVDVSCFHCDGKGFLRDGSRCYLCKGEGWLEVLGAGEVDPNVYAYVPTTEANAPGYDPEKVQGFAWGMGVERIAMLKHGIPDLRLYYENDLRFLEQF